MRKSEQTGAVKSNSSVSPAQARSRQPAILYTIRPHTNLTLVVHATTHAPRPSRPIQRCYSGPLWIAFLHQSTKSWRERALAPSCTPTTPQPGWRGRFEDGAKMLRSGSPSLAPPIGWEFLW
jgi:hypothetical protein